MRAHLLMLVPAAVVLLGGCAVGRKPTPPTEPRSKPAARAATPHADSDAGLQAQLSEARQRRAACEAEAATLRERADSLAARVDELSALIVVQDAHVSGEPDVRVSPLPPALDAELRAFASRWGGRVRYDRLRGGLTFANDRLFRPGSDTVRPDAARGISDFAQLLGDALKTHADRMYDVVVVGHTDDSPITRPDILARHPTNWHLSVHRAIAVKSALVEAGLPEARIAVMGCSSYRPISDDPAKNRRVEILLLPRDVLDAHRRALPD